MRSCVNVLMITLIAVSLVAIGCQPTPDPEVIRETEVVETEVTKVVTATPPPVEEEESVLAFAAASDVVTLDTHFSTGGGESHITQWVNCHLTWWGKTQLDPEPQLAESWTVSEDGTEIVFHIREGAKFHNGREVTAQDVEYSWNRIMENADRSRWDEILYIAESYEATDRHEFTVKLRGPDPAFLENMGNIFISIVPEEAADDLETEPIGCGPYRFVEYVPGDRLTLTKFDDYWDEEMLTRLPDRIDFRPILEEQTRIAMLGTGQVDVAEAISYPNWPAIEEAPNLRLIEQDSTSSYLIYLFNTVQGPLSDKAVRQALTYAIDREAVYQTALDGRGEFGCNFISRDHWAYTEFDCPSYDPDKALEMLEEAGYDYDATLAVVTYQHDIYVPAAEVLVENLRDIGLDAQLQVVERGVWLSEAWRGGDFDITVAALTRDPDPDTLMSSVFREGGGNNPGRYHNPRVDELFEAGRRTIDREERKQIYAEIVEIVLEEVPVTKIAGVYRAAAAGPNVEGVHMWPKGLLYWHQLTYVP